MYLWDFYPSRWPLQLSLYVSLHSVGSGKTVAFDATVHVADASGFHGRRCTLQLLEDRRVSVVISDLITYWKTVRPLNLRDESPSGSSWFFSTTIVASDPW